MAFDLVELKDEIVNDPEGLGYKNSATPNDWKGDQVIADLKSIVKMEELGVAITNMANKKSTLQGNINTALATDPALGRYV